MKVTLAVLAGCLSSLGSVFSKLASLFQSEDEQMDNSHYIMIFVICFACMVLCNIAGMFFFTKSLQEVDSSIVATVTSTAFNYISSGIFGALLFNETMSIYWILGMMFTIIGISLIATDPLETHKAKDS